MAMFVPGWGLPAGPHTSSGVPQGHQPAVRVFADSIVDFCKQTLARGCPPARASQPKAAAVMQTG